jgi:hypothetical protein
VVKVWRLVEDSAHFRPALSVSVLGPNVDILDEPKRVKDNALLVAGSDLFLNSLLPELVLNSVAHFILIRNLINL